jgi:hypothetical protein
VLVLVRHGRAWLRQAGQGTVTLVGIRVRLGLVALGRHGEANAWHGLRMAVLGVAGWAAWAVRYGTARHGTVRFGR